MVVWFAIFINKKCSILMIEHMLNQVWSVNTVNDACWLSVSCLCNHLTRAIDFVYAIWT